MFLCACFCMYMAMEGVLCGVYVCVRERGEKRSICAIHVVCVFVNMDMPMYSVCLSMCICMYSGVFQHASVYVYVHVL